jgi:L-lactate permease
MKANDKGKFGKSMLVVVLIIVLLFYFLSMKPAVAVARHFPDGMTPIRQIYFPIIWLHDHTPLNGLIESYVNIWDSYDRDTLPAAGSNGF